MTDETLCTECGKRKAVTRDNLCHPCLKKLLSKLDPFDKIRDLNRLGTEQIGRKARDPKTLGGAPRYENMDD